MTFKKSPFPYILILSFIVSIAFYSNNTLDKKMNEPITYSIHKKHNGLNAKMPNLPKPPSLAITTTKIVEVD